MGNRHWAIRSEKSVNDRKEGVNGEGKCVVRTKVISLSSPKCSKMLGLIVECYELCSMNDKEVILSALQRDRNELHDKLMQIDRIIKKVKGLDYSNEIMNDNIQQLEANTVTVPTVAPVGASKKFSKAADIKVQILTIFEMVGHAVALKDIQHQYYQLTGKAYNIREVVRALNRQKIVLMMRKLDSERGVLWVKKEWVRDGVLLDEFKPEGFDLFYQAANLIYE